MTSKRFVYEMAPVAFAALIAITFGASTEAAQEGRGRGAAPGEPGVRLRVQSEAVKGAPYAADVMTESTQTLADGNRIVRRTTGRVYRDSEGRMRHEQNRPSGGAEVSIVDPVEGTAWSLDPERRVARRMPAPLVRLAPNTSAAMQLEQLKILDRLNLAAASAPVVRVEVPTRPSDADRERPVEETLPVQMMEGVSAQGVRRTTTIAAGAIGNERPIVVTSEEWTSPYLHVLIKTETSDPRVGTSSYRLVNIVLGEPDRTLFEVPADYTVQGQPFGRGGRGPGPGGELR